MTTKTIDCTKPNCPTCTTASYGHKHVCAEHLTAYEAVTMSVVGVLAVIAGTVLSSVNV